MTKHPIFKIETVNLDQDKKIDLHPLYTQIPLLEKFWDFKVKRFDVFYKQFTN